jgi:hypothetical protein
MTTFNFETAKVRFPTPTILSFESRVMVLFIFSTPKKFFLILGFQNYQIKFDKCRLSEKVEFKMVRTTNHTPSFERFF